MREFGKVPSEILYADESRARYSLATKRKEDNCEHPIKGSLLMLSGLVTGKFVLRDLVTLGGEMDCDV